MDKVQSETTQQAGAQRATTTETSRLTRAVDDLAKAYDRVDQAGNRAARSAKEVTQGRSGLSRIGAEIRALPAVPLGGGLSTDVFGKVINTLGQLGVAGQAAALGLIAAVGALKIAGQEGEKVIKALIATQNEYYTLLKTGSRAQIDAALEEKRARLEVVNAQITENRRIFTEFEKDIGPVGRALSDALDIAGSQQLRVQTQKLEEEQRALTFSIGRLSGATQDAGVAARDAAEAEKERTKALAEFIDTVTQARISATLEADRLTGEQARQRLAAIQREIEVVTAATQTYGLSEQAIEQLNTRLINLRTEAQVINNELGNINARDAARAFVDAIKSIPERLKQAAEQLEKLKEAGGKIAELRADFADKLVQIEKDRYAKEVEAAHDRDQAIAEAQRDAQNDRIEAARQAGIDLEEAERDHQQNIQRIQREFARASRTAIQDRDAVALAEAQANRKEALSDENKAFDDRKRAINRALAEQNRQIDIRLQEQTRTAILRYNEQLRVAQIAAQRSIEIETQRFNKELADRQAAYAALLGIEQRGSAVAIQTHANFWSNAIALANRAIAAIGTGVPSATSTNTAVTGVPTPQTARPVMPDSLRSISMRSVNPRSANAVNVNFSGATNRHVVATSKQQAMNIMSLILDDMGAS